MPRIDYVRQDYYRRQHCARYARRVRETDDSVLCEACDGEGGEVETVLDDTGPWLECRWCEGTGRMTRRVRWRWLLVQRSKSREGRWRG